MIIWFYVINCSFTFPPKVFVWISKSSFTVSGVVNSSTIIFCGAESSKNTDSIVTELAGDVPGC
jgi:hypothetical protein